MHCRLLPTRLILQALTWPEDKAMQGCNLSACQGSIKKRFRELQLSWLLFSFLENQSDKSQGLGQSPKVLTGNI